MSETVNEIKENPLYFMKQHLDALLGGGLAASIKAVFLLHGKINLADLSAKLLTPDIDPSYIIHVGTHALEVSLYGALGAFVGVISKHYAVKFKTRYLK